MYQNFIKRMPLASMLFILSVMVVIISCGNSLADSSYQPGKDGIHFFNGTFEQAKLNAKESGKPMFVMVHASWCPACKKMKRNVLPAKETGDLFNSSYINVMVDYDSDEGKQFRNVYSVPGTPTLFIMDANGKVLKQSSGYLNVDELLVFGKII
jgi:thioredoxin 1